MNPDWLDAPCVIKRLIDLKVVRDQAWRASNPHDHEYNFEFVNPERPSKVILQIIKRAGNYYIAPSRIKILARQYKYNSAVIQRDCAV
jgi:hypothetical protein